MHGTSRFLYLSQLLYGICVKIFIMNRYISKSYTTTKNTIEKRKNRCPYLFRNDKITNETTSFYILLNFLLIDKTQSFFFPLTKTKKLNIFINNIGKHRFSPYKNKISNLEWKWKRRPFCELLLKSLQIGKMSVKLFSKQFRK